MICEQTKIGYSNMHCNVVFAHLNGMWQLDFKSLLRWMEIWSTTLYCNYISWLTCFSINSRLLEPTFSRNKFRWNCGNVIKHIFRNYRSLISPVIINCEAHDVTKIYPVQWGDVINDQPFTKCFHLTLRRSRRRLSGGLRPSLSWPFSENDKTNIWSHMNKKLYVYCQYKQIQIIISCCKKCFRKISTRKWIFV